MTCAHLLFMHNYLGLLSNGLMIRFGNEMMVYF